MELSSVPFVRKIYKKFIIDKGFIIYEPTTENCKKTLDVFNPSLKNSSIKKDIPIKIFLYNLENISTDRYANLHFLAFRIDIDKDFELEFQLKLEELYLIPGSNSEWNTLRREVLTIL